jgi:hypothetical protein
MMPPLSDDPLQSMLRQHTADLPACRTPRPNTCYTIQDAA